MLQITNSGQPSRNRKPSVEVATLTEEKDINLPALSITPNLKVKTKRFFNQQSDHTTTFNQLTTGLFGFNNVRRQSPNLRSMFLKDKLPSDPPTTPKQIKSLSVSRLSSKTLLSTTVADTFYSQHFTLKIRSTADTIDYVKPFGFDNQDVFEKSKIIRDTKRMVMNRQGGIKKRTLKKTLVSFKPVDRISDSLAFGTTTSAFDCPEIEKHRIIIEKYADQCRFLSN